ncbi:hypothetical protein AAE478_001968 [Parahypoxylon ruwenzoriense]
MVSHSPVYSWLPREDGPPNSDANHKADEPETKVVTGIVALIGADLVTEVVARGTNIIRAPVPLPYSEPRVLDDDIAYFNKHMAGNLISFKSVFNPYQVDPRRPTYMIARIYINTLVSATIGHRIVRNGLTPFASSVTLINRMKLDLLRFRVRSFQELKFRLTQPDQQTSDSTLTCVIYVLMVAVQHTPQSDWKPHLEGARTILLMRGGLSTVVTGNPYLKPLIACIDVMAAVTSPSTRIRMGVMKRLPDEYGDAEIGILRSILATSVPCPEELFSCLMIINYIRPIVTMGKHPWVQHVFGTIHSFNPTEWAKEMKHFRGWNRTGDDVDFDMSHGQSQAPKQPTLLSSESYIQSSLYSSVDNSSLRARSTGAQVPDLWLSIGVVYHAAMFLYATRTLILDAPLGKLSLDKEGQAADYKGLRLQARQTLVIWLTPLFRDIDSTRKIGKLVFFPLFVCGMEVGPGEGDLQNFILGALQKMHESLGTYGPATVMGQLKRKWATDAAATTGCRLTWDHFFQGSPEFVFAL